jgi:hypothetical protein
MTAAVALAVVLVIAVAGLSLAMQTQRSLPGQAGGSPSPPRQPPPPRRVRERRAPQPPPSRPDPDPVGAVAKEPEPKGPELLRTGTAAAAKVLSVVDERVVGPVTRSRLNLAIEAADGHTFEITVRFAFPTPAARSKVKVGGTIPVRYDPDDHGRVVVDLPA